MQHHPCAEPHSGEVFFVGSMTGDNSAVPTEDQVFDYRRGQLPAGVRDLHRARPGTASSWTWASSGRRAEGWGDGDRGVICYVYNVDESTSTGSVKATP